MHIVPLPSSMTCYSQTGLLVPLYLSMTYDLLHAESLPCPGCFLVGVKIRTYHNRSGSPWAQSLKSRLQVLSAVGTVGYGRALWPASLWRSMWALISGLCPAARPHRARFSKM